VTVLTVDGHEPDQSGEFALWVAAAVVILALHVGLAVAYLWFRPEPDVRATAPAFEVAFMPAAAPPSIDQPDPAPTKMDQVEEPPKEPPPPVQEAPPPPTPQVEAMVPPEPPPPAPPIPAEPPPPPPVPEQLTVVPPEKPVVVPEQSPRKAVHEEKVEKHQAPPKVVAPQGKTMRVAAAPSAGVENEGARLGRESWLSQFAAQIRHAASYPSGSTGSGTAQISVTVARNGRLVSHHLTASAGSPALDHAAMAAIERAQPFPPFPASMPEAQISRTVPLHLRPQ
jgi:protein TonB